MKTLHYAFSEALSEQAIAPTKSANAGQAVANGVAPLPPVGGSAAGVAGAT